MASEAKAVDVAAPEAAPTVKPVVEEAPVVPETKAEVAKEEAQAEATPALNGNGNHAAATDAILEKDIEGGRDATQRVCSVALPTATFD